MQTQIQINTGEMAVDKSGAIIKTGGIGSCVAVCMYDDTAKVGGMAHAMLPTESKTSNPNMSPKYVDEAVELLLKKIESMGGNRANIKAKITGGAKMFKLLGGDNFGMGYKNIEQAKETLNTNSIPIESEDVGGTVGRIAQFDTSTGTVEIISRM